MALKTVGDLKDEITGILTGLDLDNVVNLNGALERAARTLSQQVYIPETTGKAPLSLYDGVNDYVADTRVFGSTIVDFRPQTGRDSSDNVSRESVKEFDRNKDGLINGVKIAFEYLLGTPILRVAGFTAKTKIIVDAMDDDTDWAVSSQASNLELDENVYYNSPASLRFDLTGVGLTPVGVVTKAIDTLDLSDYEDVGVAFLAIRIPDTATASQISNVAIKLGSSDTAYDSVSTTEGFLGAWRVGEWTLVALDFSTSSATGTPNWSAIDYLQVRVTHTAAMTNFRIGGLFISLPSAYEMLYKSSAIFNNDGVVSTTITDDNDELLLNDAAYNLYVHEASKTIALQNGGSAASGLIKDLKVALHGEGNDEGLYTKYRSTEPDDTVPFQSSYARLPRIRK
jgi:hypothetical protein